MKPFPVNSEYSGLVLVAPKLHHYGGWVQISSGFSYNRAQVILIFKVCYTRKFLKVGKLVCKGRLSIGFTISRLLLHRHEITSRYLAI